MSIRIWGTCAIASSALVFACDRKAEQSEEATVAANHAPVVVEQTTVTAIETIPSDAGEDAAATVVGVTVTTLTTKGNPVVVEKIAEARCAREQLCGNVGSRREYEDANACRAKIASDWADDLNRFECPGGYDQKELDECLTAIRNEDCKNPFDTLGRLMACRASDICLNKR